MRNVLPVPTDRPRSVAQRPLIIITEGVLDIACLTTYSRIVHAVDPELPDLQHLTADGRAIFLPAGGGDLMAWTFRLAPLGCPEFLLCDREQQPETDLRQKIVERFNQRAGCRAALTGKRSLENYLHPAAISATFGITVEINDCLPVAEHVAKSSLAAGLWADLSRRSQQRLIYHTKRRLNVETVRAMTAELLSERDPYGEVMEWFRVIASLLT